MTKEPRVTGLLPVGLSDVLPPFSEDEARCVRVADDVFASNGYERVSPPALEFEETLFDDRNTDLAHQTFRLTDPMSGKMMGIRSDMTPQLGRIAATRLKKLPRPLRLRVGGIVVRSTASALTPDRQLLQAGAELIGADTAAADAEIILTAAEALTAVTGEAPSVDLTLPTLFKAVCVAAGVTEEDRKKLVEPLNQKDFSAVRSVWDSFGRKAQTFIPVLECLFSAFGTATDVLAVLDGIDFPPEARAEYRRLKEVVALVQANAPDLEITIDALENRGFEYHCGVSFSFFSKKTGGELGRGGRYFAGLAGTSCGEPATGVTLFLNAVLNEHPVFDRKKRVYVPFGVPFSATDALKKGGCVVVRGLRDGVSARTEALSLRCDAVFDGGQCVSLNQKEL